MALGIKPGSTAGKADALISALSLGPHESVQWMEPIMVKQPHEYWGAMRSMSGVWIEMPCVKKWLFQRHSTSKLAKVNIYKVFT